jgi:hypothetical protein
MRAGGGRVGRERCGGRRVGLAVLLAVARQADVLADCCSNYTLQAAAEVQDDPPSITLQWLRVTNYTGSCSIWKRPMGTTNCVGHWGQPL